MQISNEHVSSQPSPIEVEETETSASGGQRQTQNEDDFEDDREPYDEEDETEYLKRKKRAAKKQKHRRQLPESVRRKLREQKAEMREAIRLAKEANAATEYRGSLNRAELVLLLSCLH